MSNKASDAARSPPARTFLSGGGEMGRRIREHEWSGTPLGPPDGWPQALRSALGICLQSSFPTAIYWGPELRLLYNDAWAPIAADKHPWALGRPAREVWPDIWHVIEPQLREVQRSAKGLSTFDQMLPMQRGGRTEETYWNYSFTPILSEDGSVEGVFNQGHETTEQVLAARSRQAEVERLRELFQQAPGAVALLSGPRHVFSMANPAYIQLVGHRDVIGKPVAEALPEVTDQGFIELLDDVYRSGTAHVGEAVLIKLRPAPDRPAEDRRLDFVYQPIRSANGAVSGIFVQASDVTERFRTEAALRRSEAELREADRRKDEFLAMLAHELRNPLAPILNAVNYLRFNATAEPGLLKARAIIERQVRHMARLVDDLLDVSRITRGKVRLRKEMVDLGTIVASAVETSEPLIQEQQHTLTVELPDEPVRLEADGVRLSQVLSNLLNNAARYTPSGGRIELRAERDAGAGTVVVTVRDNGIGIAPEHLDAIFDLFTQTAPSASRTGQGLGIGLHLARLLVRLHGGDLEARSAGPDAGSDFIVTLPVAP